MRRNLFVLHTQYNIILGVSYKEQYCLEDRNDLVVYAEFEITENWKRKLGELFNHVYYVRENFEVLKRGLAFEKELKKQINDFDSSHGELRYDRMIISQDRPFEQVVFHKLKKVNPSIRCIAVEEDAYFTATQRNSNIKSGMICTIKAGIKRIIREVNFGYNYVGNRITCYGSSKFISELYVNFPEEVRSELNGKDKLAVTADSIRKGIELLYGANSLDYPDGLSVIIASDLIERYRSPEIIVKLYSSITDYCKDNNMNVYFKYHPRAIKKLPSNDNIKELPLNTAIENILLSFNPGKTCIVGNMSTSVLTAKKLGFYTVSVVKLANPRKEVEDFFEHIGICVPASQNEMLNLLQIFGEIDE